MQYFTKVFLQNVLLTIGSAFLFYVNHFKLYSSFCASHSKAQKVLHPSKLNEKENRWKNSSCMYGNLKCKLFLFLFSFLSSAAAVQMKAIKHYRNFYCRRIRGKSIAALSSHILLSQFREF